MAQRGQLAITKDNQSGKWTLHISAKLSKTGKKRRLKFDTKVAAEKHRKKLAPTLNSAIAKEFDETLWETANYYQEAFQLYGFKNLGEACVELLSHLEQKQSDFNLLRLIKDYKITRGSDWSSGYIQTYQWAKKQLKPLHEQSISTLDAKLWQEWLPKWRQKGKYAAKSFNHLRTFLLSIYSLPKAASIHPSNPLKVIPPAKIKKKEVSVFTNDETKKLLNKAWQDDPELVPWFAIAIFAGLRPQSELGKLRWEDINFKEKWIRVGFGNKTDTKRFVDLSETLILWLKPFSEKSGNIIQTNHRKRKDKIAKDLVEWDRDITRHTYGSNLEAQARYEGKDSKAVVISNMGHSSSQTFEQHYRNARTAKQAEEFWNIQPPSK